MGLSPWVSESVNCHELAILIVILIEIVIQRPLKVFNTASLTDAECEYDEDEE